MGGENNISRWKTYSLSWRLLCSRLVWLLLPAQLFLASWSKVSAQLELPNTRSISNERPGGKTENSLKLRSVSHPFSVQFQYGIGNSLVAESKEVGVGSNSIDWITCSLLQKDVTWLGTGFGVKRIDNLSKTVRHYTVVDGLPYDDISSLAYFGGRIYCCAYKIDSDKPYYRTASAKGFHTALALCRLDETTGRWATVIKWDRKYPPASFAKNLALSKDFPFGNIVSSLAFSSFMTISEQGACLVTGPGKPGCEIARVTPLNGGLTRKIPCPSFVNAPFQIRFAHADSESLWVGGSLGLLRFDFKRNTWERFLNELTVTGGCSGEGGSLWLITKQTGLIQTDSEGDKFNKEDWRFTHFVLDRMPEHFLIESIDRRVRQDAVELLYTKINRAEKKIWATSWHYLTSGHGWETMLPGVYSLNVETKKTKKEVPSFSIAREYSRVPAPVLADAEIGFHSEVFRLMPERFPGWFCFPPGPYSFENSIGLFQQQSTPQTWNVERTNTYDEGRMTVHQVLRHDYGKVVTESFAFPQFKFASRESVIMPTAVDGKVYFLSQLESTRLYCWDRKTDKLEPIREMDEALVKYQSLRRGLRLFAEGRSLWVGIGKAVLRYDLDTKRVRTWAADSENSHLSQYEFVLLSVCNGRAWITNSANLLFTAGDLESSLFAPFALAPLPANEVQNGGYVRLIGVEDGIIWFQTKSASIPRKEILIGYEMEKQLWTTSLSVSFINGASRYLLPTLKQGSIRWLVSNSKLVAGYDTEKREWKELPEIPKKFQSSAPILASIDEKNAWSLSDKNLFHLDRRRNSWSVSTIPYEVGGYYQSPGFQDDNLLYISTPVGLMELNLKSGRVVHAPAIESDSSLLYFQIVAKDSNALWIEGRRGGEAILLRFDVKTQTWNMIPSFKKFPADMRIMQWVSDGESCWFQTLTETFHLVTQTGEWEAVSARIGGKKSGEIFQQIVPDGDSVWLVASISPGPFYDESRTKLFPAPPKFPIYRYRISNHTFSAEQLPSEKPIRSHYLTMNSKSVLLASDEGCFRFDRISEEWERIPFPKLPSYLQLVHIESVSEGENYFVFTGDNKSVTVRK